MIEENPDGVLVLNKLGVILYANKSADRLIRNFSGEFLIKEFNSILRKKINGHRNFILNGIGGKILITKLSEIKWDNQSSYLVYLREAANKNEASVNNRLDRKKEEKALEKRLREITLLNELALAGTEENNEEKLIIRVGEIISDYFKVENVSIMLKNNKKNILETYRWNFGIFETEVEQLKPQLKGITGKVLETGEVINQGNVLLDEVYIVWNPEIRSELCVPIKIDKNIIGVINLESAKYDAFYPSDENILILLGKQLAITIEKYRLYEETRIRTEELASLHEITLVLTEELDKSALLYKIYEQIDRLLAPDIFSLSLIDKNTNELIMEIAIEEGKVLHDWTGSRYPLEKGGLTGWVILNRKSLLIADIKNSDKLPATPIHSGRIAVSWLGVPLIVRDNVIGALTVQSFRANEFNEMHRTFLKSLGRQVSVVLENSRLYEQEINRKAILLALHEVDLEISSNLDPEKTYQTIVKLTADLMDCEIVSLYQVDQNNNTLLGLASYGLLNNGVKEQTLRLNDDKLVHEILEKRKIISVENARVDFRISETFKNFYKVKAVLASPLIYRNDIRGILFHIKTDDFYQWNKEEKELAEALASRAAIAIENAQLYKKAKQSAFEFETLFNTANELSRNQNLQSMLDLILGKATQLLNIRHGGIFLYNQETDDLDLQIVKDFPIQIGERIKKDEGLMGKVIESLEPLSVRSYYSWENRIRRFDEFQITSVLQMPLIFTGKVIGILMVLEMEPNYRLFDDNDIRILSLLASQAAAAIHSAQIFRETTQRVAELETLNRISNTIRDISSVDKMLSLILEQVVGVLDAGFGTIYLMENESSDLVARCYYPVVVGLSALRCSYGVGLIGWVAKTGQVHISKNLLEDEKAIITDLEKEYLKNIGTAITLPIETDHEIIGVLGIGLKEERSITEYEINILESICNIAATAIQRAILFEQTRSNLEKISALRSIDRAIISNLDLNVTLDFCLENIISQLHVDTAVILKYNKGLQLLEYQTGRGFTTNEITHRKIRLGVIYAGQSALEQRTIAVKNIHNDEKFVDIPESMLMQKILGYCVVPLVARGEVKGVLEVMSKNELDITTGWIDFLETLAEQAAIAIDNSIMFDSVKRSNLELIRAYDQTIKGWSKALEMRQMEVEGHSERVTKLAESVAREMGLLEEDILSIRRGAMLHDIGKMSISDNLLNKEDDLSDEEWKIVKKHPLDAYNILSPISFLRTSLDIPYYHHERWDGSGYPHGLRSYDIPLAARIFAVVDVWDSLHTHRKYRNAWPEEQILGYIYENAGKLFDPNVVDAFFKVIGVNPSELSYDLKDIALMKLSIQDF